MPYPLRDRDPDNYHLVTARTEEARIWMIPDEELKLIVGGVIARYQELLRITIFAACVLGNHLHILLKASNQNLHVFMENVLREIARRVNKRNNRKGHFWYRRYDDQVILNDEDFLEAFLYVSTNAVKHGLVKSMKEWPGFSTYPQSLTGESTKYPFVHYSKLDDKFRPVVSHHTPTLTPLPKQAAARPDVIGKMLQEREISLANERAEQGGAFLGSKKLKRQPAGSLPIKVSKSPRPVCYTKDSAVRQTYAAKRRSFTIAYAETSIAFRGGNLLVEFPEHCYKPPLHKPPRPLLAPLLEA